MPSPTRIVTARHPSRVPRPNAAPRASKPIARVVDKRAEPEDDLEVKLAAADRVWRIVSGQEKG